MLLYAFMSPREGDASRYRSITSSPKGKLIMRASDRSKNGNVTQF